MNYSRAFTYVFDDKDWLSKLLIAGLISLIPIVGQFYLLGWMIEIVRRVKAGRNDILPTTHFVYFLTLGLKMFVVCLIYAIPLIIITALAELISGTYSTHSDGSITIVVSSMGFFGTLITLAVRIAIALISTYGVIKLAETDQIKACLNISDAFNTIKNNLSAFIVLELLSLAASIIGSAGLIVCFIGIIFTMPYATAITGHLSGQLWNQIANANNHSFRGSMSEKQEDVVEEAPFTRVEDIENKIDPINTVQEAEQVNEEVTENTVVNEDKPVNETVLESTEENKDNNTTENDIPRFE